MKTNANTINGLTDKRYIGKICTKHPELGGLRLKSNYGCLGCHNQVRDRVRKNRLMSDPIYAESETLRHKGRTTQKVEYNKAWRNKNREYHRAVSGTRAQTRRAAKLHRTVAWADQEAIAAIYKEAKETGMSVDHIVPLQGKLVSGLHVEYNLQLLPASDNFAKCNKFEPITVKGEWKCVS